MKDGYWEIKPVGKNVLLGLIEPDMVSAGGIHYIDRYRDDRTQFMVLAIGAKVESVKVGDRVVAPLYFSHLQLEDGTGRRVASEDQFIAVVEKEEPMP